MSAAHNHPEEVSLALREHQGNRRRAARALGGAKRKVQEHRILPHRARHARDVGACHAARMARVHHYDVIRKLPQMGHNPVAPNGSARRIDPYAVWTFLRDERTLSIHLSVFSLVKNRSDKWASRAFLSARIDVREPWETGTQPRVPLALCEAVTMHGATWRHPMARAWRVALLHNDTTMAPWAAWVAATSPTDPPWMADATEGARMFVESLRRQHARWVDKIREDA